MIETDDAVSIITHTSVEERCNRCFELRLELCNSNTTMDEYDYRILLYGH